MRDVEQSGRGKELDEGGNTGVIRVQYGFNVGAIRMKNGCNIGVVW